jgi:hypothetical protein
VERSELGLRLAALRRREEIVDTFRSTREQKHEGPVHSARAFTFFAFLFTIPAYAIIGRFAASGSTAAPREALL